MHQQALFHEDFEGALSTCVAALGGAKVVGVMLRPEYEKDPDKAQRWLLACLNSGRDEKLSWDQTFKILLEAKAVGCHAGMAFIAKQCGYAEPQPVEPQDEAADLERQFIGAVDKLGAMAERINELRSRTKAQRK